MNRDVKYLIGLMLWLVFVIVIVIIGTLGYALAGDTPPTPADTQPPATVRPRPTHPTGETESPTDAINPRTTETEFSPPPDDTDAPPPYIPPEETAALSSPAPQQTPVATHGTNGDDDTSGGDTNNNLPTALPNTGGVDRFVEPQWFRLTLVGSALMTVFLFARIIRWGRRR